jgi:hypothetical protein
MAGSGFAQFMISSIKSNSRRTRHTSFDKNKLLNNISKKKNQNLFLKKLLNNNFLKLEINYRKAIKFINTKSYFSHLYL